MTLPSDSPKSDATPPPPPSPDAAPAAGSGPTVMRKQPILAGILSLFPGAGNVYNGLYLRGVTFFTLATVAIYMAHSRGELWGFVIAFIWIFNVLDAWRQANLINLGYTSDLGLTDQPRPAAYGSGGIIGGAALLLVGLVAALEIYFDVDIDRILNLWPLVLIGLGAYFIYSSVKVRLEARSGDDPLE